jgi:hypothetical protein
MQAVLQSFDSEYHPFVDAPAQSTSSQSQQVPPGEIAETFKAFSGY